MSTALIAERHRLARRFDRIAIAQLRAEVSRLATENERLRDELDYTDDLCRSWQDDAMALQTQLADATGGAPGITMAGQLVVVADGGAA